MRIAIVALAVAVAGALTLARARSGEGAPDDAVLKAQLVANRSLNIRYLRVGEGLPRVDALREIVAEKRRIESLITALHVAAELEELRAAAVASMRADVHLMDAEVRLAEVEAAAEQSDELMQERDRLIAEIGRLAGEARTRHARMDDLAFQRGLLPFRVSSPF